MSNMKCESLSKSYGKNVVLTDMDLTLESGKIYGLIGRNGTGKTTMLSIMSNQNPATGGKVTLDGENIWENRKALDRICFSRELNITPENGLSAYTVKMYLDTAAAYFAHWDKEMAANLVKEFGLKPKTKLGKLSKGMLSMVTIIVAMASKAEFTFLDEPVAGLDVVAREQFYKLLLEEYTETGRTFVISTHIIEEAADVMEEVIILNQGKIVLKENTQELVNRARYVTGLNEEVDRATAGLECHHPENMGRSKGVTVLLKEDQEIDRSLDVTVQPLSLQKIFVALCGEEAR
ncbi:MAG: ABC transporter ATP-binding protein [Oscillospiraceae bacterium]|nr:ABC transporter ATP-binding protein [Oscillospiraceae bacterium]